MHAFYFQIKKTPVMLYYKQLEMRGIIGLSGNSNCGTSCLKLHHFVLFFRRLYSAFYPCVLMN